MIESLIDKGILKWPDIISFLDEYFQEYNNFEDYDDDELNFKIFYGQYIFYNANTKAVINKYINEFSSVANIDAETYLSKLRMILHFHILSNADPIEFLKRKISTIDYLERYHLSTYKFIYEFIDWRMLLVHTKAMKLHILSAKLFKFFVSKVRSQVLYKNNTDNAKPLSSFITGLNVFLEYNPNFLFEPDLERLNRHQKIVDTIDLFGYRPENLHDKVDEMMSEENIKRYEKVESLPRSPDRLSREMSPSLHQQAKRNASASPTSPRASPKKSPKT